MGKSRENLDAWKSGRPGPHSPMKTEAGAERWQLPAGRRVLSTFHSPHPALEAERQPRESPQSTEGSLAMRAGRKQREGGKGQVVCSRGQSWAGLGRKEVLFSPPAQ